ncbi:hypothetical protein M431DRAFT_535830 [Trichoderma harzianum CBS 226.95]|uniref:Uncharacterized protein n=1 Tax=Trichoderma harzianum CBS 226.95 TaxID=983964 RepID=A0A2T3ZTB4_TRIHA|nr:hypothetical protein M431DRAFT_535830 [Trichoderma harzianum CBS 226.95]PTB48044.1 hypothetical protein M431DRAFT_535830 [Trichoderma harzianum CBS 226.95]
MSLGFEVDFLALIGLVNQVRKSFAGAPEQFKAISDDVRGFSIVLQDVEANYTDLGLEQTQEYQEVVTSCKHLLEQLKKSLEKYSGVAEAAKSGKKAGIKRVWKRLKWEPDDIRDIRSQISFKIATLRSLNDQVTSQNIIKLIHHQENTEREATVKWVSDINYVAQQNDIFLRCQTGSRKWLFESEVYLEWCKRKGSLLFCPGNPGTGKTFTTAMVVESLRLANDAETLTTYMYCTYQNHTQTIEKLLCSLLRVALEEADHEADGTVSTCTQLRLSNKTISRHHCLGLLQDLFSRFERVNLIVDAIDELTNEVRRPLIYDLLKLHKNGIVNLLVTSRGIPEIQHIFESCEGYTSLEVRSSDEDIRNFLRESIFQLPNFVARSRKLQDEVIDSVTSASAGMFLLAELYLKSLATILSVGSLRTRLSNLATGSNAYDTLYEDSVLRIGFQGPESERIAVQTLLVLTCARRPLSPQELSHALSIDEDSEAFDEDMVPDIDDLIAVCTGLVVSDDTSKIVHLVHRSAAEYFERTRSRWFPRASEKMALLCLRYIRIAEAKPGETRKEAPFFHYAKANWSYHSMESEKEAAKEAAVDDVARTNSATNNTPSSMELAVTRLAIVQMTLEVPDVHSSIVDACHAGQQAWVEQLSVVRNYDMNEYGTSQKNFISDDGTLRGDVLPSKMFRDDVLLTIAAARGDCSMALMLLAQGADPNIFNTNGQTPLIIAATNGFDEVVSLLLDQKSIKPDLMCQHSGELSTAFLASIELGREGCFRMLVEKSNRGVRDSYKRGAMWLAATSGHTGIISELLKWPDVEIDYTDTDVCGNPLTAAVRARHEEAALLLLPYSKCRSCTHCGITPMHHAVINGYHNLLKRLLEHDASAVDSELYVRPRGRTHGGRHFLIDCEREGIKRMKTPLTIAISLQDAHATQLLLPYADANQNGTWRPLHGAATWGDVEIFELLLKQANIEPDPIDRRGRTPFLLAAELGNCDIMNALIKKGGIKLDRKDANGHSASDYIVNPHFQNPDYFRVLASAFDIDVNEKDSSGSNILHYACCVHPTLSDKWQDVDDPPRVDFLEADSSPLVTELLNTPGVDVNLLDKEGNTPLLLAVKNHQRDVVRLLLEREDTDVLAQDENGDDAILLSSTYQPIFEGVFPKDRYRSLKKHDLGPLRGQVPDRYKVDNWPEVLDAEFKEYDDSIFSMLLHDKRTEIYRRSQKGQSIVARVAMTGTKNMVQAALETTELVLDLEIKSSDKKSLLTHALQGNQDDEAVDLLIARCDADFLRKPDAEGRTPLSYAVQRATSQVTQSLLEAGTNINATDRYGKTSLSYAAEEGHPNTACLLIAADEALINTSDFGGFTPLMHASYQLNIPVISVFLERPNVDLLALDAWGHSFLCHLMRQRDSNIDGYGSEKEIDGVIHRIHHFLQPYVNAFKGCIHSPFLCALKRHQKVHHRSHRKKPISSRKSKELACFMDNLKRYAILSDLFHPGLDFSRCETTDGLFGDIG